MACYFVSDTHLGLLPGDEGRKTEEKFVAWLDLAGRDAQAIFLVGDIFDFWFEYRHLIPKGFTKVFAKIGELTARGVEVHFFPGNHDMWTGDFFGKECGMTVHSGGRYMELCGKKLYIDHGDNTGHEVCSVRLMQGLFRSAAARRVFSALVHPGLAMKFGRWWSRGNRGKRTSLYEFRGEGEPMVKFAREYLEKHDVDYFVFGHLHTPVQYDLGGGSTLCVLGEWIRESSPVYGVLDVDGFRLQSFER